MSQPSFPGPPGAPHERMAGADVPVGGWVAPGRAWRFAVQLVSGALMAWMLTWNSYAIAHPLARFLAGLAALGCVFSAVGELRGRVLLEPNGLVIVRTFRRARIAWRDVQEVRVRGSDQGRGWVEVVLRNSRVVLLPAPVEACAEIRDRWERATAAGRSREVGEGDHQG